MRVALNAWFAGQSVGSGQYTDRLAAALADRGDVRLDLVAPRGRGSWVKLWFEQRGFPQAARRLAADLAHVPYWAPPLAAKVPVVVTVHDLIPLILPAYRRRADVQAYTALVSAATRHAAAVIADSRHTANDLVTHLHLDPARIHVVPLGVDLPAVSAAEVAALREALSLPPHYGLYLGGFDERKNLATLFAAWRGVHAATGVPLLVAGRLPEPGDALSPQPAELARQAGLADIAWRTLGPVAEADKATLLAGAAVFAFPSRYEGFGLPPLEAMAAGCPVVACDAASLPEVVGEAGLLVGPADVVAWVAALTRVLGDPILARRLARDGPVRAASFTWRRTAEGTMAAYDTVLLGQR